MEVEERRAVKELNEIIKPLEKRLVRLKKARDLILGADAEPTVGRPKKPKARGIPGVLLGHLTLLLKQAGTVGLTAKEATIGVKTSDYKFINGQNEHNIVRSCIGRMEKKNTVGKREDSTRGMVYFLKTSEREPLTKVTEAVDLEADGNREEKDSGLSDPEAGKSFDSEQRKRVL